MKKKTCATVVASVVTAANLQASVVLSEPFSYSDGNLAGKGGWTQNSTNANSPVQVVGGKAFGVIPGSSGGQDVFVNFAAPIQNADGTFAYYGLTLNLTAANGTGEYFAHFTNGVTNPSSFTGRLGIRESGNGFQLGYSESTNAGFTFGSTELAFNTEYRIILRYGFVAGALNDTGAIFVSPLTTPFDPIESNNAPYVVDSYNGSSAEFNQFTGFQFRQATTSGAEGSFDNLIVSTDFASAIPEPSAALSLLGATVFLGAFRRRR